MNEGEYYSAVKVLSSESNVFSVLVSLTSLKPEKDFRSSDLREVDFSGSDLSDFDFTRADLRNARWEDCLKWPLMYRFAMMGSGNKPITANDFERLVALTENAKLWAERFRSFALIVDNFGVSELVFEVLDRVVTSDKSTYMRKCSYVYFAASYVGHYEAQNYCFALANEGGAYSNMHRIRKVRRMAVELEDYLQSLDGNRARFPGEVSSIDLAQFERKRL